jgi:hypothetical protein
MDSVIEFNYFQFGFSLGEYIALAVTSQSFVLDQEFYMDMSGYIYESDEKITRDSLGLKVGAAIPLGALRVHFITK